MASPQKIKGSQWERDAAKLLTDLIDDSQFKRIPGSGAIGTIMKEPFLGSDIRGVVRGLPELRFEAKVGYGGSKQMALKKEWLEHIRIEAERVYGLPAVIGKFSGAHGESKIFIAMDVKAYTDIINTVVSLDKELESLAEKLEHYENVSKE